MHCSKCGSENPAGNNFCVRCGNALVGLCAKCGAENSPTSNFCGKCGSPLRAPVNPSLAETPPVRAREPIGERRHLTILFCDLVGSTTLAAQVDPEEWRATVAGYQRAVAAAITHFEGEVVRYVGDGIMAFFGYPVAHDNDAERAARAGLAILDAIAQLNRQSAHAKLSVRIGIDSGAVVVSAGAGGGQAADAFGDAANIAARVQAAATPDTVLISDATQRLVSGLFVVEDRGAQELKGIERPVRLYRVIRPSGMRGRFEAMTAAGGLTPFVGREDELRSLRSRWERVLEGEGQVTLISGEAGIGKSRLVQRFHDQIAGTPHTWIEAGAGAFFQNTPFYPISELLRQLIGDTPDQLTQLAARLTAAGLPPAEAVSLIAPLLNLPLPPEYPPLAISPEQQRRRLLATLVGWVLGSARAQPLVIAIEDLHWVDPSTLELIQLLVEQGAPARLLLLCMARPEFRAPWTMRAHHTQLTLNRLSARHVRTIVGEVATQKALSEATIATVVERTGGVPLFVEELTRAVLESGDAELTGRAIPVTLHDSLMARLDRLGPAKEVIQVGAVLGSEFSYELLHAVQPLADADLQRSLRILTDAELLYVRGIAPEATYQFKHALIRDAAYEALLKSRRRQLHSRVVEVLREQFLERAAAAPEVMARHAELAGQTEEAIMYYRRAGEHAQARSAHGETIAQFRKAIALFATQPESAQRDTHEVTLQLLLGESLIADRGFAHPEVEVPYERARVLCEAVGDAGRLAIAQLGLSYFHYNRGDVERGRALASEVLALAEAQGSVELLVMAHQNVAEPEYYQGKFASSLTHCERALALYDPRHHSEFLLGSHTGTPALGYIAWNLWNLGWPDSALARAEEAVSLGRRLNHPFSLVRALFFETEILRLRGDSARQHERAAEVVALSEMHEFPLFLGVGRCWMVAGDVAGLPEMLEALTLIRETGYQSPGMLLPLAETQQAAGQLAEARATVAAALAISAQLGLPFLDADLQRFDGDLILATGGAAAEAAARYRQALDIARAQEAKSLELRAATSLALLWRDQGKRAEARDLLGPLYAWFTEGLDTADLKDAKALLDELGV